MIEFIYLILLLIALFCIFNAFNPPDEKCKLNEPSLKSAFVLPKELLGDIFSKEIHVRILGPQKSGKKTLLKAYKDVHEANRFYFPSERIYFEENDRPDQKIDVIWFVVNYHARTSDSEFNILRTRFPHIPVIIVLNQVDVLQEFNGDTFDLVATDHLPEHLTASKQLSGTRQRYKSIKESRKFNLSQVIMTSMRDEESFDRPVGLLGLYQATLNCIDEEQFKRFGTEKVSEEGKQF